MSVLFSELHYRHNIRPRFKPRFATFMFYMFCIQIFITGLQKTPQNDSSFCALDRLTGRLNCAHGFYFLNEYRTGTAWTVPVYACVCSGFWYMTSLWTWAWSLYTLNWSSNDCVKVTKTSSGRLLQLSFDLRSLYSFNYSSDYSVLVCSNSKYLLRCVFGSWKCRSLFSECNYAARISFIWHAVASKPRLVALALWDMLSSPAFSSLCSFPVSQSNLHILRISDSVM